MLPALDPLNREYWTGGAQGQLKIMRCRGCRLYVHPPLPRCPECGADLAAQAVSGKGRIASFTINHQAWLPGMKVPFVFAAVELAEQAELYVFTNIVGCPCEDVRSGMAVEVRFTQQEEVYLPMFAPGYA